MSHRVITEEFNMTNKVTKLKVAKKSFSFKNFLPKKGLESAEVFSIDDLNRRK